MIWVDADACPSDVKELLVRAAERLRVRAVFVANKPLNLPRSDLLSTIQVPKGLDIADTHIAANAKPGDLAVTQDIPLAAALVKAGVVVIDVRGELLSEENIGERLSVRNFAQELREGGVQTSGPEAFGPKDKQRFAATLDRELTKLAKPR
jgi:uncharacterized protein YaiI (UPF0178 family)